MYIKWVKVIKGAVETRPSWSSLEQHCKNTPVPEPHCGEVRSSFQTIPELNFSVWSSSSSSSSSFSFCSIFPSSSSSSSSSTHIPFSLLLLFLLSLLNREPSLKHFDENHSFIYPLIYRFTHSIYSITSTNIYWSPTACLVLSFLIMSQWTYLNLSLVDQDLSVPKAGLHPGASFVSCRY